jgi:hypothetical protein
VESFRVGGLCVSIAVRIGIVGFGLLVAFAAYEAYTRPGDSPELIAAQNAVAGDTVQKLLESLPSDARWTRVSVEEATAGSYRLTLHYAADAGDPAQVKADTSAVALALVRRLTVAGHHPADERMAISVTAREDEAGPLLAVARFDPDRDGIAFDKPKP